MYRCVVYVSFVIASSVHLASAEDWYRFRGPRLDGVANETEWRKRWPQNGLPVSWTADVGIGFSSVVVSENRVYTIGNRDNVETLVCLDEHNGQTVWKHEHPAPIDPYEFEGGPTSTPTIDGEQVFTLSRRGEVFAVNKQTGQVDWHVNVADLADVRIPGWGFAGSPLVSGDRLILNVGDAGVGLDKSSGALVWRSADKDAGYSTPVPIPDSDPSRVILGSARSYVCVEADSGEEVWRQRWLTTFGCNAADPLVDSGKVFLSSGYNRGCALLELQGKQSPEVLWQHKEMQNQLSSSVMVDGLIYGIHGDVDQGPKLRCLDWSSGEVVWTEQSVRPGGLMAADGHLILLSDDGELLIAKVSAAGFDLTARQRVMKEKCWTAPVLSGGRIYCRGATGTLVCIDVRDQGVSAGTR